MKFRECANDPPLRLLAGRVRALVRGRDVVFHGTRYARKIILEDWLTYCPWGTEAVNFTRSPEVAAYFALLGRDDDEGRGAVLILDRERLRQRYRLQPYHDAFWDTEGMINDEAEEIVYHQEVYDLSDLLVANVQTRERLDEGVPRKQRKRLAWNRCRDQGRR